MEAWDTLVWGMMEFGLRQVHESEEMLYLIYSKKPFLEPLIFNLQFVQSVLAMVTEIQSSKNETLKSTPLDVLRGVNVNDFIKRQSNLGKLKRRVDDVGCMPLGRIFKTETRMWSWFEDFLLIKLVLRHGYSYLDDVIDDPIWQLCTPRI